MAKAATNVEQLEQTKKLWCRYLQQCSASAGKTQVEMADKADIARGVYGLWVRGERVCRNPEAKEKLANAFAGLLGDKFDRKHYDDLHTQSLAAAKSLKVLRSHETHYSDMDSLEEIDIEELRGMKDKRGAFKQYLAACMASATMERCLKLEEIHAALKLPTNAFSRWICNDGGRNDLLPEDRYSSALSAYFDGLKLPQFDAAVFQELHKAAMLEAQVKNRRDYCKTRKFKVSPLQTLVMELALQHGCATNADIAMYLTEHNVSGRVYKENSIKNMADSENVGFIVDVANAFTKPGSEERIKLFKLFVPVKKQDYELFLKLDGHMALDRKWLAAQPAKDRFRLYIQALRQIAGITQGNIAETIGYETDANLSSIESGRKSLPPERLEMLIETMEMYGSGMVHGLPNPIDGEYLRELYRISYPQKAEQMHEPWSEQAGRSLMERLHKGGGYEVD